MEEGSPTRILNTLPKSDLDNYTELLHKKEEEIKQISILKAK